MKDEIRKDRIPRFPVFHVPHDGGWIPDLFRRFRCVPEDVFYRYHEKMRDTGISLAVPEEYRDGDMCEVFRISRLVCDPERFIGPEEVMEKYGMGFCYERAYDGTRIKQVTPEIRERALRFYRKHHARMDEICRRHPRILLIDLHSYSDEIVPADFLREGVRTPDLCIGTDERYTPPELPEMVRRRFSDAGFGTAVNYPYAGCYVPDAVLSGTCGTDFAGVMLEFHKRTYCDDRGQPVPEKLGTLREIVQQVIADCADLN